MTEKIFKEISSEAKSSQKVTSFYVEIQTMEAFRLSPGEYSKLHSWDKKALNYYMLMKNYHEERAAENAKQKAEHDEKLLSKLPKVKV